MIGGVNSASAIPPVLNGERQPRFVWKAATRHRVRLINITHRRHLHRDPAKHQWACHVAAVDQGRCPLTRRSLHPRTRAPDDRRRRDLRLRSRNTARAPEPLAGGENHRREMAGPGAGGCSIGSRFRFRVHGSRFGWQFLPGPCDESRVVSESLFRLTLDRLRKSRWHPRCVAGRMAAVRKVRGSRCLSVCTFLRIARASLFETRNHIEDGVTKKYFSEEDASNLLCLQVRATKATTGLLRYLESCKGRAPTGWNREP